MPLYRLYKLNQKQALFKALKTRLKFIILINRNYIEASDA